MTVVPAIGEDCAVSAGGFAAGDARKKYVSPLAQCRNECSAGNQLSSGQTSFRVNYLAEEAGKDPRPPLRGE